MAYATAAQLEEYLGRDRYLDLADRDRDGTPDEAAVEAVLSRASAIADSYIARYLPLAEPYPEALADAVIQIATYTLAGNAATDDERARYEDALRWLREVAAGQAELVRPTDPTPPTEVRVAAPPALWTQEQAGRLF